MKKTVLLLLTIVLLSGALIGCEHASEDRPEKTTENSAEKESPVSDFEFKSNPEGGMTIKKYLGDDPDVVIPKTIEGKPVTQIGDEAFSMNNTIVSVKMPDSVTVVGKQAFFASYTLSTVELSENLESIGYAAFINCPKLSSVTLPSTLKIIGSEAFAECKMLKHINIPGSIIEWGSYTFLDSGLETVEFEEGLESIGWGAFAKTNIKEIVLPSSVKIVDYTAFSGCTDLESVTLNEGLISMGNAAFGGRSNLKEIIIPSSVENMNELVFNGCTTLESVKFEGDAPRDYSYEEFKADDVHYTVYYHEGANGFTSPEWNGYPTEIW